MSIDITASQKGVYLFFNPPINEIHIAYAKLKAENVVKERDLTAIANYTNNCTDWLSLFYLNWHWILLFEIEKTGFVFLLLLFVCLFVFVLVNRRTNIDGDGV